MSEKPSRAKAFYDRITKDPDGPQMKRIDCMVHPEFLELFKEYQTYTGATRREALETALVELKKLYEPKKEAYLAGKARASGETLEGLVPSKGKQN